MADIEVGHDEANIACTIVLLKNMVAAGYAPMPLAVQMCPPGLEDAGWRQFAIDYLTQREEMKQHIRKRPVPQRSADDWAELNDELDYDDRKRIAH